MKKLIYMIATAAIAIPVVALAQGACGSCSKGDRDMAKAKEHMKEGAKDAKDAAAEKMKEGKQAAKDAYENGKESVKDAYQDSKDAVDHTADRAGDKARAVGDAVRNG